MKKLLGTLLLLVGSAFGQLATQEATPLAIQAKSSAADTLAYRDNVTNGDELIVGYSCFSGGNCATGPGISDTLTTSWTSRVTQSSTTCGNLWIWTGKATSGGADTVTITNGGSFKVLMLSEFSNVTDTLDVATVATGWSGSGNKSSPSFTTTTNGALIYSAFHTCTSGYPHLIAPLLPLSNNSSPDSTEAGWEIAGAAGSYTTTFNGIGSSGNIAAIALKAASALQVVTTQIPDAVQGTAYSFQLNANQGSGSYTWTLTGGSLPTGLSLASSGVISGTPTFGNGDASLTFQVADGASHTATKSLILHTGTSANTPALIRSASSACNGVFTVTAGDLLLIQYSMAGSNSVALPKVTDSVGTTFANIPVGFELGQSGGGNNNQQFIAWGFAASSSGSDTITCGLGGTAVSTSTIHEFSNLQKVIEPAVLGTTVAASASPYTSSALTLPVAETLFSWVSPNTSTATVTTQSPYTAGVTTTASSIQSTAEYQIGAGSGSRTASYVVTSNTDLNWGIGLLGFRASTSGTAPQPSSSAGSAQVY